MSDGANLGVSASVALGKILGGKNIPEDEIKTKEQVRDRITAQFADPASVYPNGEWLNVNANKTHCKNGHEFTDENTGRYQGKRVCRACNRAAVARYKAKAGES